MKKALLIAAMSAVCLSAFAGNDNANPCGNNGNNCNPTSTVGNVSASNGPITNSNTNNVAGGTGLGVGVGVGIADVKNTLNTNISNDVRNNASAAVIGSGNSSNDNRNTNTNLNTNNNKQDQNQGQAQGQSQSTKNSNNAQQVTSFTQGDINFEAQKRDPVSSAYSNLAAPSAPCMGSSSVGAQGVGFGISVGSTWTSDECNNREDIRTAYNYGDKAVAEEMIATSIKGYAEAKQRIADRKAGK